MICLLASITIRITILARDSVNKIITNFGLYRGGTKVRLSTKKFSFEIRKLVPRKIDFQFQE